MSIARVNILIGQSAHDALSDTQFLTAWRTLYAKCEHATGFQAPPFVCGWYEAYRFQWQPVVIKAESSAGELTGLWLLAHDPVKRTLAHAGAHQAEYQAWLILPGKDASFLTQAWPELQRRLPFATLQFKYLSTASLADELRQIPALESHLSIKKHSRPLMKLDAAEIKASFAKKSNKSRFNRLKKLGDVEFRRITEPVELERVFDDLIDYYDFRQGAVNQVAPFREDQLKRGFYTLLFSTMRDEAHVTVTYLNGRAVAALWGTVSGKTVHLGMLIHSPHLAEYSPGKLHVMQLSEALLKEGKEILDLTPGGDPWKERFANAHDEVAEVILYRSPWQQKQTHMLNSLVQGVRQCVVQLGARPTDMRSLLTTLRQARPSAVVRQVRNWHWTRREFRVYRGERNITKGFLSDTRVRSNSLADLLSFEPDELWPTQGHFFSMALSRLERGEFAYTVSIDRHLAHCGWMMRNQAEFQVTDVHQSLCLPADSVAFYDFYTHPDFRNLDLYPVMLRHMVHDAFSGEGTRYAYIPVSANDLPSRNVIEALGFQYQGSLYWECRLGAQKTWASPALVLSEPADA